MYKRNIKTITNKHNEYKELVKKQIMEPITPEEFHAFQKQNKSVPYLEFTQHIILNRINNIKLELY